MIRHIVLYKIRTDIPKEQVTEIFERLVGLKQLVDGIIAFSWGAYNGESPKNYGYNYAICVDLKDSSVFKTYSPHPVHQQIRIDMAPMLEEENPLLMFDYELTNLKENNDEIKR